MIIAKSKFQYSILNTFIGLFLSLFVAIIICISWKIERIVLKSEQEQLNNIAVSIQHSLANLIDQHEINLSFLGKLIIENKYYQNTTKVKNILDLIAESNKNEHYFHTNLSWNPSDQLPTNTTTLSDASIILSSAVKDSNNKVYGLINTEITYDNLMNYISYFVENKKVNYAIIGLNESNVLASNFEDSNKPSSKVVNIYHRKQENLDVSKFSHESFGGYYSTIAFNELNIGIIFCEEKETFTTKKYLRAVSFYKKELILSSILLFFIIYVFYKAFLNPFITLSNAALQLSKGETPQMNKLIMRSKEGKIVAQALEKIKHSFNIEKELVQEISKAHNKLSITNLRLENKVAQRTQDLEKSIKAKDRFISYLTYELKAPIQSLTNLFQTKVKTKLNVEQISAINKQVITILSRISSMLNDLSDLKNISDKTNVLNISNFSFKALLEEIIYETKILYLHDKNINLNLQCKEDFNIFADKDKIAQVIRNLISSSVIKSKANSNIALRVFPTNLPNNRTNINEKALQFVLVDQNDYHENEQLTSIFSEQNFATDNIPFLMCNEIVSNHNGKIWANLTKDGGLELSFIIPLVQSEIVPGATSALDLSITKYNILMIDDEESSTSGMEVHLKNSPKYNLIKCNSGQEGLDYLAKNYQNISIILLDLMIPDVYGINILNEIKSNPKYSHISVVLQTGSTDEEEIIKAFNAGINCFVKKPYNKNQILKEIEKALRLYKLNQESDEEIKIAS